MKPPPMPTKARPRKQEHNGEAWTPLVQYTHEHDEEKGNEWQGGWGSGSWGWVDYAKGSHETVEEPQPSLWLGQDQSQDLYITSKTHERLCCQGTGTAQATTFEFATWKQEPDVWQDRLTTRVCDEPAIAQFFAL